MHLLLQNYQTFKHVLVSMHKTPCNIECLCLSTADCTILTTTPIISETALTCLSSQWRGDVFAVIYELILIYCLYKFHTPQVNL